jgi:starch-binding outer membrane protein, SusD/RagB family
MNKHIKTASVIGVITLLASCNKYIETTPHDRYQVTALDYLQSESDYRTMEISVYTPLEWLNQVVPIGDIASDNAVAGGESASDVLDLQQIDDFTLTPVNGTLSSLWQYAYEGVNRANYILQYKDKNPAGQTISFAGKDALYGEVYFLRAYYYFTLAKMFGDVPLFTDKRLDQSSTGTLKRIARATVYQQVETDLNSAIAVLPAVQVQQGRITKYAAQALLGKVFLYQNKYDSAIAPLQSIINAGAFSLVTDFSSIFLAAGENGPESLFEIQYTNTSPYYQWSNVDQGQGNYMVQQCGIRGLSGSAAMPYAPGWSTNLPTQNLAAAYSAGDQRKAVTVLDIEAYKTANPSYGIQYQVAPYKNTGLYDQKYLPRKGETSGQPELNYLNNFRIIRYAEVLLMAAEALNKSATPNDAIAQTYLNQVRRRAFGDQLHDVTATGANLYTAILNERRLELAMEGDRFFDLVRTGQAATVLAPNFKAGKHELFPIPDAEIKVSHLTQNNGY